MKHHQILRRGLGILLSLVLCLSLLPATVRAEGEQTETADFETNSTRALDLLNASKTGSEDSTWDSGTNTLTLKGVNFTTTAAEAVMLPAGSKIVLANGTTNTITSTANSDSSSYGIYGGGALTIEGNGTLNVTGGKATGTYGKSYGIYANYGNITISGGTVTATGGDATGDYGCYSYGIHAPFGTVTISGGTVTATGGAATTQSYGINSVDGLTISGGNITAMGGTATESYGICSDNGNITISGGTVTATGGAVTADYGDSRGIHGSSFAISGNAKVTATGGTATGISCNSYGISSLNGITISDNAEVTATSGTAIGGGSYSYGICCNDCFTISGGTVTATGGVATAESYGIYYDEYGVNAIISGGHVIARTLASATTTGHSALYIPYAHLELNYNPSYYWRTGSEGGFTASADTPYTYSEDHTYVEFTDVCNIFTVNFDVNGAGGSVTPASAITGSDGKLSSLPTPTREGYTFDKWYTAAEGGTEVTTDTEFNADATIYAHWTLAAPSITTQPASVEVNEGEDVTFTIEATGAEPTYQWQKSDYPSWVNITGATAASYTISPVNTDDHNGNLYRCVVSNSAGTVTSDEVELTVHYTILEGANSSWVKNSNVDLHFRASGPNNHFETVSVDGTIVDGIYYTQTEGSTIIDLHADYLNTLAVGSHTIEFVWSYGTASTTFTITTGSSGGNGGNNSGNEGNNSNSNNSSSNDISSNNGGSNDSSSDDSNLDNGPLPGGNDEMPTAPKTGDNAPFAWLFLLEVLSVTGLILIGKKIKRTGKC